MEQNQLTIDRIPEQTYEEFQGFVKQWNGEEWAALKFLVDWYFHSINTIDAMNQASLLNNEEKDENKEKTFLGKQEGN